MLVLVVFCSSMDLLRPPTDIAGLHAVMSASDRDVYIDDLPPGGQLAMAGAEVGDALVGVNGRSVEGLSLRAVRAQLEGPSYTTLELEFRRDTAVSERPKTFTVTVIRAPFVSEVRFGRLSV